MFVCHYCEKDIQGVTIVTDDNHLSHPECAKLEGTKVLVNTKWDDLGFLDGLKGHVKPEIAALYECCNPTILTKEDVSGHESKQDVQIISTDIMS